MTDKTVPVYIRDQEDLVQVGMATPNIDGVRRLELEPRYADVSKVNLIYGDDPVINMPSVDEPETFDAEIFADVDVKLDVEPAEEESVSEQETFEAAAEGLWEEDDDLEDNDIDDLEEEEDDDLDEEDLYSDEEE